MHKCGPIFAETEQLKAVKCTTNSGFALSLSLPSITPPQWKVLRRDGFTVTHRLTHRFYSQGQYSPSVPSSVAGSTQTPPTGCKTTVHNAHSNTPQHHQKPYFAFFFSFFSHIVVLFSMGPCCLKGSVNEFQTISGIEIYWQNSDEPACLPARLRGSHCPECSEHMLLSCAACLTAKGWFNYINCLMTEERAAGPCMLVCDKRETLLRHGPSLCKSDSNLENLGNCTQYKAYVSCFF